MQTALSTHISRPRNSISLLNSTCWKLRHGGGPERPLPHNWASRPSHGGGVPGSSSSSSSSSPASPDKCLSEAQSPAPTWQGRAPGSGVAWHKGRRQTRCPPHLQPTANRKFLFVGGMGGGVTALTRTWGYGVGGVVPLSHQAGDPLPSPHTSSSKQLLSPTPAAAPAEP